MTVIVNDVIEYAIGDTVGRTATLPTPGARRVLQQVQSPASLEIYILITVHSTPLNSLASGIVPLWQILTRSTLRTRRSGSRVRCIELSFLHLLTGTIADWATHGICGRGVLLDLVSHQTSLTANKTLPYDPWATHAISVADLEACAKAQGVKFRRGDILILRVGFIKKYYEASQAERDALQAATSETLSVWLYSAPQN